MFYNSIPLQCDDDANIMWGVIKWAGQFIGSDLYVTVHTVGLNVDGGSQYASRAREQESVPVTVVYPSITLGTSSPYNSQPWNGVAMDNTENAEMLGSIHTRKDQGYTYRNEDIQTYLDKATKMDNTRDVYEEFIDNDGPVENPELLDELQPQNNPNPNPE